MLKIQSQKILDRYIDAARLDLYLDEVTGANRKFNLYSRNLARRDLKVLISESFVPVELGWIEKGGGPMLDIGSGWGLPAIPLLLAGLDLAVTMVERSRKKADFLLLLLHRLKIDAAICDGALESVKPAAPFKLISMRGVAIDRKVIHNLKKMIDPAASLVYFGPRPGEGIRLIEDVDYIVDNLPARKVVRAQII
jgi:16S rRNA G527 N7-methylase RsmG